MVPSLKSAAQSENLHLTVPHSKTCLPFNIIYSFYILLAYLLPDHPQREKKVSMDKKHGVDNAKE